MIGIDANVLVALAVAEHPRHSASVSVFDRELAAEEEIVLAPSVAAEFLHVVPTPGASLHLATCLKPWLGSGLGIRRSRRCG